MASLGMEKSTLGRMVFGVAVLALFVLLVIMPNASDVARLNQKIRSTKLSVEEQKILHPQYAQLKSRAKEKDDGVLPQPKPRGLTRDELDTVLARIKTVSREVGVEPRFILPDPDSVTSDHGYVAVNGEFKGTYENIRRLLIELGSIESMSKVQNVELSSDYGELKLRLKIWLALTEDGKRL